MSLCKELPVSFFIFLVFCSLRFFWMWIILKSLLNLLQYCFCLIFWFCGHKSHGILVPQQGIEPTPPALEGEVNHWTTRDIGPRQKPLFLPCPPGITLCGGSQPPHHKDPEATIWSGPWGKELRPPANSQHHLTSHGREPSWK